MKRTVFRERPVLSAAQLLALAAVLFALIIALDLNRKERAGEAAGAGEEALRAEISIEQTRQVQLQETRAYVESDDYVADYARNEAGYILPGEARVVPLVVEATPAPTPLPLPTADPATVAQPWQAWWQLLTDVSQPTR